VEIIRCSICDIKIGDMHYAIRDMKPTETYFEWLWRHVVTLFTFGLNSRKHATILPVCDVCARGRLAYNIGGVSNRVG
jgi:hypothetical protein